jgi:Flp pilus assembly protein TadB
VRVYTAQGRLWRNRRCSIAVGCAIFVVNRQYMLILIQDQMGRWLLLTGAVMQILAHLSASNIEI